MTRTRSFYDLRDALAQPGCALCRLANATIERYLDSLLWERVTDPITRHSIRQARGLCPEHARRLVRPSAPLGIAILSRDVIQTLLRALDGDGFQPSPRWSLKRAQEALDRDRAVSATEEMVARLDSQQPCPACTVKAEMENIHLDTLLEELSGEAPLLDALASSGGLCLPHLRKALARARNQAAYEALVQAQRAAWQRLDTELAEFIRKNDARFRDEPWGEERDAWRRALDALAGSSPDPA